MKDDNTVALSELREIFDEIALKQARGFESQLKGIKSVLVGNQRSLDGMRALTAAKAQASKAQTPPTKTLIRSIVVRLCAVAYGSPDIEEVSDSLYGPSAPNLMNCIRDANSFMRTKAVTNPAQTTVAGWAAELVNPGVYAGLLASLSPLSIYASLGRRGITASLAGVGSLRFPARTAPGSLPSPFVGEGQPVPVRALSLNGGGLLVGHKAGAISWFTKEMSRSSTPSIEAIVRQGLSDDIGLSIDSYLISNAAATFYQPAGLLNGVTPITASTATGAEAAAADLSALAAAIQPSPVQPVFLMNGAQAVSAGLLVPGIGNVVDVLTSDVIPAKEIICLDAADFVSAADDGEISVADGSTFVPRDDPVPVSQGASGAGADTAQHVSLWQLDCIGVRVLETASWAMRRAGRIAYVEDVSW
ncbi:phage major capsid protein [Rhizobium sp. BK399]|uniref:phage major capsid family protein n=1 Tax=Rhizobium sp. BK399 TaxID=2587063 RepID=UPI00161CA93F|nr:phage major capsid protein [Rhizobium sp. BK399]MBB3540801.1 hypothetical protein [Rhizobium sp. BK399]